MRASLAYVDDNSDAVLLSYRVFEEIVLMAVLNHFSKNSQDGRQQ